MNVINSRIKQRIDTLSNWILANPVLLNGELAIVVLEDGSTCLKVGDALSSRFNDLEYVGTNDGQTAIVVRTWTDTNE